MLREPGPPLIEAWPDQEANGNHTLNLHPYNLSAGVQYQINWELVQIHSSGEDFMQGNLIFNTNETALNHTLDLGSMAPGCYEYFAWIGTEDNTNWDDVQGVLSTGDATQSECENEGGARRRRRHRLFESGSMPGWIHSWGDSEWYVCGSTDCGSDVANGSYMVRSGDISHSQSSWLSMGGYTPTNTTYGFAYGYDAESCCDHLRLYVDGSEVDFDFMQGSEGYYQGELDAGFHTLTWSFSKDLSVSVGSDSGWLDDIHFGSWNPYMAELGSASPYVGGAFCYYDDGSVYACPDSDFPVDGLNATGLNVTSGSPSDQLNFTTGAHNVAKGHYLTEWWIETTSPTHQKSDTEQEFYINNIADNINVGFAPKTMQYIHEVQHLRVPYRSLPFGTIVGRAEYDFAMDASGIGTNTTNCENGTNPGNVQDDCGTGGDAMAFYDLGYLYSDLELYTFTHDSDRADLDPYDANGMLRDIWSGGTCSGWMHGAVDDSDYYAIAVPEGHLLNLTIDLDESGDNGYNDTSFTAFFRILLPPASTVWG